MKKAALIALALFACATTPADIDDRFEPDWMTVVMVERTALRFICERDDLRNLSGCARLFHDRQGADGVLDRGTCVIYVARELSRGEAGFDYVLRHEAKHCRGWRHPGD